MFARRANSIYPILTIVFVMTGCASGPKTIPFSEFTQAADITQEQVTEWSVTENGVVNEVPAAASPADLASGKAGATLGLLNDFRARDVEIEIEAVFEGSGAPGIVFRAQRDDDGRVSAMYAALMSRSGVSLWRLMDRQWQPLGRHAQIVTPGESHRMRVVARGADIVVWLDGVPVIRGFHTVLSKPGAAGIIMREGRCMITRVQVTGRSPEEKRAPSLDGINDTKQAPAQEENGPT